MSCRRNEQNNWVRIYHRIHFNFLQMRSTNFKLEGTKPLMRWCFSCFINNKQPVFMMATKLSPGLFQLSKDKFRIKTSPVFVLKVLGATGYRLIASPSVAINSLIWTMEKKRTWEENVLFRLREAKIIIFLYMLLCLASNKLFLL